MNEVFNPFETLSFWKLWNGNTSLSNIDSVFIKLNNSLIDSSLVWENAAKALTARMIETKILFFIMIDLLVLSFVWIKVIRIVSRKFLVFGSVQYFLCQFTRVKVQAVAFKWWILKLSIIVFFLFNFKLSNHHTCSPSNVAWVVGRLAKDLAVVNS